MNLFLIDLILSHLSLISEDSVVGSVIFCFKTQQSCLHFLQDKVLLSGFEFLFIKIFLSKRTLWIFFQTLLLI